MALLYPAPLMLLFIARLGPLDANSAAARVKFHLMHHADGEASEFTNTFETTEQSINLRSHGHYGKDGKLGFDPGDAAPAFQIKTLDGEFVYPPAAGLKFSLIIHAYTAKSAFLECLWTSESSLMDLVEGLPNNAQALFVSYDDTAAADALWMREQIQRVATAQRRKDVLARVHFSPLAVHELGNWIPSVLYSWSYSRLPQVVFTSSEWDMPLVAKRLDARYDWLRRHWGQKSFNLVGAGDGCKPSPAVAGAIAWISEGNCSFFTKVRNMASSEASGVLVYAAMGNPIQDMNCEGSECLTLLTIPASMVPAQPAVDLGLQKGKPVNVSFQSTAFPNFFMGIDQQGALAEMGLFAYPSFSFFNWQAQWFDFSERLRERLAVPVRLVKVLEDVVMQGDSGAVATVDLPPDMTDFNILELDASLSCPGKRDVTCPPWDHTVQLYICCDHFSSLCNQELGRWITAFRRGTGHWLTDVSPLIPLLNSGRCTFTMKTAPWAKPWVAGLRLRFSHTGNHSDQLYPFSLRPLYTGGVFDKEYNKRFQPIKFTVPLSTKKVEVYAVITGHGSDENGCGEFCVTSHHFLINGIHNNSLVFDSAGTALGCAMRAGEGAVPNEFGTWLYGRGGWCDGMQVDPWRIDVTKQLNLTGPNSLIYFGLYQDKDPNPTSNPGNIIMSSYLVFYK
ncbi:uncharacterized protein si:dkey-256h2.1 [Brienomyrus brachyistius]|uniref:uncharacterized protein si:dkey-256h2.1 n=1 Tax=Brienomyrus brachyistius TaxID=42636 RepID=UPI0020B2EE38|nr:uncharacterized protein si:dkey-256h2.1 [Brienomyrus brachyistius]